jgi:hypothetical protein
MDTLHKGDDDDDDDDDDNNNVSVGIHRMWNMKYFIIPVVPGSTGIVTKDVEKYLTIIPVKQTLCKKTAVLETSHLIRKVVQS